MKNTFLLNIIYELLWFAFAAAAAYLLILPVKHELSEPLYRYLFLTLFLVFTYFRFITFMMRSIILENVWVKVVLFILNFPLFFLVLNQYFTYNTVVDEYNFTLPVNIFQHIRSGTDVDDLIYIKQLTVFSGTIALMLIVVLQMRIVYAMFKLRQLDKYIKN